MRQVVVIGIPREEEEVVLTTRDEASQVVRLECVWRCEWCVPQAIECSRVYIWRTYYTSDRQRRERDRHEVQKTKGTTRERARGYTISVWKGALVSHWSEPLN